MRAYVCLFELLFNTNIYVSILCASLKVVKMSSNSRANPTHHEFGSGWVEIFLQISRLI